MSQEFHTDTTSSPRMTPALRDGLVILAGLTIATGSFFNRDITMWWMGV